MSGMDVDEAASILTTAVAKDSTVSHAASLLLGTKSTVKAEPEAPPLPLYQFLQLAGLMGPKELEQAVRVGTQDTDIMARMLLKARIMEARVIDSAVACADLVAKKVLTTEQAIMALTHSKLTKGSIFDSFDEFGWSQPPQPHSSGSQFIDTSKRAPSVDNANAVPEPDSVRVKGVSQAQIDGIATGDFRPIGPAVFEQAVAAASAQDARAKQDALAKQEGQPMPDGQSIEEAQKISSSQLVAAEPDPRPAVNQATQSASEASAPTNKHAANIGQLYPQNALSGSIDAWASEPPQKPDRKEISGSHAIIPPEPHSTPSNQDNYRHMLDGLDDAETKDADPTKQEPKPRKRLIDLIP